MESLSHTEREVSNLKSDLGTIRGELFDTKEKLKEV
jgi:hypothetical protein